MPDKKGYCIAKCSTFYPEICYYLTKRIINKRTISKRILMRKHEPEINSAFEDEDGDAIEVLESVDSEKYLIFSILGRLYSFPSRIISEIAIFDKVYPLPLLPEYVPGIINRYSVPHALFDIGLLLFNSPSPRNKVLVLKEEIDRIALLIDDVSGITDVSPDMLLNIDKTEKSGDLAEAISATFNWNDANVFVLDIENILGRATDEAV